MSEYQARSVCGIDPRNFGIIRATSAALGKGQSAAEAEVASEAEVATHLRRLAARIETMKPMDWMMMWQVLGQGGAEPDVKLHRDDVEEVMSLSDRELHEDMGTLFDEFERIGRVALGAMMWQLVWECCVRDLPNAGEGEFEDDTDDDTDDDDDADEPTDPKPN